MTTVALALAVVLAACSSSSKTGQGSSETLAAEVASYDLAVGPPARFLVGVLTADKRGVSFGTVQLRFCFLGANKATLPCRYGQRAKASFLTIPGSPPPPANATSPQIVSSTQSKGVYATQAAFGQAGFWRVEVVATVGGAGGQTTTDFQVNDHHVFPAVGDPAIPSDNLTATTPNTPPAAVDSRAVAGGLIPDPELHQTTIAAAMAAHRPVVVVFSTPVYCISRFCGPITDMVGDLARVYANRATFIHVEIWHDYQQQQINKVAADWLYRDGNLNEPWVFLIGADGNIAARFDNVTTRDELEPLLRQPPVIGP